MPSNTKCKTVIKTWSNETSGVKTLKFSGSHFLRIWQSLTIHDKMIRSFHWSFLRVWKNKRMPERDNFVKNIFLAIRRKNKDCQNVQGLVTSERVFNFQSCFDLFDKFACGDLFDGTFCFSLNPDMSLLRPTLRSKYYLFV